MQIIQTDYYSKAEVLELLSRFTLEETQRAEIHNQETDLPQIIKQELDSTPFNQLKDNCKKYKRRVHRYYDQQRTVPETINK
jgi:hypothetical protein